MNGPIVFPGLGIEVNIDPVAFSIFGKEIYWYGILIAIGILAGILGAVIYGKTVKIESESIFDVALIAIPSVIVGARIYYVLMHLDEYKGNLIEIFYLWKGGIAIYGGLVLAIFTVYFYVKKKKIPIGRLFDAAGIGLMVGQIFGRWGNFINQELYGQQTDLPWRMGIFSFLDGGMIYVHPTPLYESFLTFIGVFILIALNKYVKKHHGELFLMYLMLYGVFRAILEPLRSDAVFWGPFRPNSLIAYATIIGAILVFYLIRKGKINAEKVEEEIIKINIPKE